MLGHFEMPRLQFYVVLQYLCVCVCQMIIHFLPCIIASQQSVETTSPVQSLLLDKLQERTYGE